jgi:putative toxin-antitoxin system antitoxin component (TIGR02293 family)
MDSTVEIINLLGGPKTFGRKSMSEPEVVSALQSGLPYRALEALKRRVHLTDAELVESMNIHPRTLIRRKSQKRLRSDESDRLSRLALVIARAIDVLGSEDNAVRWLRQPNGALGGIPPLRYLSTDLGARRVEAILTHIDYGDFS